MGFVMKNGKTGLDQERVKGEHGAPDVIAVGGAASIEVTVSYARAAGGDVARVAYYPRGSEAPMRIFYQPEPIAQETVDLSEERPVVSVAFQDVPAGDYDVYYHLSTGRGDATEWTNTAPNRLEESPAPVAVSVGSVTQAAATDIGGFFGGDGGITIGL